jgi:hypothetical protein
VPSNYEKFRYVTRAGCGCDEEIYFDQPPPDKCDHRNLYYLDKDYEAAKRITAESVAAKLDARSARSLESEVGTRPVPVLIYNPSSQTKTDIDRIFSSGADL